MTIKKAVNGVIRELTSEELVEYNARQKAWEDG